MPCVTRQPQSHRVNLVPSWPSIPIDMLMHEAGMKCLRTPAYVHRLLNRDEWKGRADVQTAIDSERDGLLLEGTWKEDEIYSKESIVTSEARLKGETIHLASLMTIVSIKGYEKEPGEWKISEEVSKRSPRGSERFPRGAERFPRGLREVSERSPRVRGSIRRGIQEVSERFPGGLRAVPKRYPRGLREVPRGLREVPKRYPRGLREVSEGLFCPYLL